MREVDLLKHVYASNRRLPSDLLLPPGDDMAAIRFGSGVLLVATDQVIAGVHVDLKRTPLELVGRKAIGRSVSDIAAMAGRPVASLVSVALPRDFGEDRATTLFDAMREAAEQMNCPLIGGDIAILPIDDDARLLSSVTVLADAVDGQFVTRAGATVGDAIYVTGELGGSLEDDGLGHHLTFTPRVREARTLSDALGTDLHAMIDLSDGLGRDASHIAEQSEVAIELDANCIPCRQGVSINRAISDGEDYELCFAAAADAVIPELADVRVTRIGRVVAASPQAARVTLLHEDGTRTAAEKSGWEHT